MSISNGFFHSNFITIISKISFEVSIYQLTFYVGDGPRREIALLMAKIDSKNNIILAIVVMKKYWSNSNGDNF